MKKIVDFFISPWMMGVLFVLFAVSMGSATFIENDFGPQAARAIVYEAWWFELIFILLAINMIGSIFKFKLYKNQKLTILVFHLAFLFMIIGGAFTRYIGYEGTVSIREGNSSNLLRSSGSYLVVESVSENLSERLEIPVLKSTVKKLRINQKVNGLYITSNRLYSNAMERLEPSPSGQPIIGLFLVEGGRFDPHYIMANETINHGGFSIAFNNPGDSADLDLIMVEDTFLLTSRFEMMESSMMTQVAEPVQAGDTIPLELQKLYTINGMRLVVQEMLPSAQIRIFDAPPGENHSGFSALVVEVSDGALVQEVTLRESFGYNQGVETIAIGDKMLNLYYGPKFRTLPFSLYLEDFQLERYPGSNSPSSFASQLTVEDMERGESFDFKVFMNNVLDYRGYRFFQSSYDTDEMGTILSVNHDKLGTLTSYSGYILLILGIILSVINRNSYLRKLGASKTGSVAAIGLLLLIFNSPVTAQQSTPMPPQMGMPPVETLLIPDTDHARNFSKILVQDNRGRTKPIGTLSSELLRKVSREDNFMGLNSEQIFISTLFQPEIWATKKLIKVSNESLSQMLGYSGKYLSFQDFLETTGDYKLRGMVETAYAKRAGARNKLDKEIIKVDERVNIFYMMLTGEFLKVFPVEGDTTNTWQTPNKAYLGATNPEDSSFLRSVMSLYLQSLSESIRNGDYASTDELVEGIMNYQRTRAQYDLPSEGKVGLELLYNRLNVFKKLFPFYALCGIILLILLIIRIVSPQYKFTIPVKLLNALILVGLFAHTAGLAARWYISGHAPMSNGYESMVFISWVTVLAGFIFARRSPIAVSATAVLAALTLMVANLSFMDPEITALVPVLKSVWLTLHVSVITSSYGFLGLGAILGLINLILYGLMSKDSISRIEGSIVNLTSINRRTIILGLYLLTIGTFLGAVWANESWGRYWGWDPKETWSLITIIVYSFVSHMRLIPGMKGTLTFNISSLFGFSSVLMTYFGVNYYLSGLHSYAGGDPVPVPRFVFVTIVVLISIAIFASWNHKKIKAEMAGKKS